MYMYMYIYARRIDIYAKQVNNFIKMEVKNDERQMRHK